jgi:hypothetical protein
VKRERVYRPPLGRGALVKVVRADEDDVMCFDERSDVSNFSEADERETRKMVQKMSSTR